MYSVALPEAYLAENNLISVNLTDSQADEAEKKFSIELDSFVSACETTDAETLQNFALEAWNLDAIIVYGILNIC
jgi:hypothetical protein